MTRYNNLGLSLVSYTHNLTYPSTSLGRFHPEHLPQLQHLLTTQTHHTGARTTYACVYRLTQLERIREYRNQDTPNSEQESSAPSAATNTNLEASVINHTQASLESSIVSAAYWNSLNNPTTINPLWQDLSSATKSSHESSNSNANSLVRSLQGYLFAPSMCSMLRSTRADAQFLSYTATKQIDLKASDALTLCGHYQLFDLRATHLAQAHAYAQVNAYTWELRNRQLTSFTQAREVAPRTYGEFTLEDNSEYIGLHSIYQVDVLTPLAQRSHKAEQIREPYIVQFHNDQSQHQAQANLQILNQQANELRLNPTSPSHLRNQLNLKLYDLSRTSHAELQAWREQIEQLPQPNNRLSNLYQALTHLELKKLFTSVLHNQLLQETDWVTVLHGHYEVQDNFLACLQTWQQHTGVGFMVLDTALHSHVMHCYFGRGDNSRHTYLSLNPRNVLFPSHYQRLFTATMPYYNRTPQPYLGQGLGLSLADNWKLGLNFATHVPQLRPDLLKATIAHCTQLIAQQHKMWQGIQLTATAWYLGLLLAQLKVTQGQTLKYPNLNYSQYHLNRGKEILSSELERLQKWTQSFNPEVAQEQQAWLEHLAAQLSSSAPVTEQWQNLQEQLTQTLQITNALHAECKELIQADVGNLEHLLRCNINQLADVAPNPASEQLLRCHFQVVDTLTTLEAVTAFQTPIADELANLIHSYLAQQTSHLQLSNSNYASVELDDYISWVQYYTHTYATTSPVTRNLNLAQLVALCMQYWLHLPTTRCSSNVLHGVALESHIERQAGIMGQQQLCFRWRCLPQGASTSLQAHTQLEITPAPTPALSSHPSWMQYAPVYATHIAALRELFATRAREFHNLATVAPQVQSNWSSAYQEVYQHIAVTEHLIGNYLHALATIHASTHFSYIPSQLQALQVPFSSAPITVRIEKLEPDEQRRELWLTGRNPVYREYKYPLCELFNLSPLSLWRNQLLAGYAPHNENEKLVSAEHTARVVSSARTVTTRAPQRATVAWHEFACLLDYLALNIYPHAGLGHTGNIMPLQTGQVIDIMSKYRHIDNQIDIDNDYIDLPVQFYAQRLNYPTIANRFTMRGLENFAITKELIRKLQPVWEQPDFRTSDLISGLADLEAQETIHSGAHGITRGNYHVLVTRAQLLKSNLPTIGSTDLGVAHHWNNPFATQITALRQTYIEIRYLNLDVDTLKAQTLEEIFVPLRDEFARYGVEARLVRQPAVHGRKLAAAEYYERFDEEGFKQKYYRVPAFGEVGCTLSYVEHMHAIAASDHIQAHEYVILIEDDLSFARSFVERVVTILRQLEQMQDDPCQHPPRWVNGFHYLFNSLSPLDPRDFKQLEHTHIHGLHTQYQVAGVNILRLERFTTSGSVCSLIRKDLAQLISHNLCEQQIRPYWLADDFVEYPGMSNSDYAFTNPRLTILAEEYHNASNINDERARKRAYATYLGQPLPTY